MVKEMEQDGGDSSASGAVQQKQPVSLNTEKPKEKRITVDSVIDDMAKNVVTKTNKATAKEK